jgi:hypothetical protein
MNFTGRIYCTTVEGTVQLKKRAADVSLRAIMSVGSVDWTVEE